MTWSKVHRAASLHAAPRRVGTCLTAAAALVPAASAHTPYGMTEALPATDVSLDELLATAALEDIARRAPHAPTEAVSALACSPRPDC